MEGLRKVLRALQSHGFKLRATKCDLFKREVRYVSHLVSAGGVHIDPKDLEAVYAFRNETPATVGMCEESLGFWATTAHISKTFPEGLNPSMGFCKRWGLLRHCH